MALAFRSEGWCRTQRRPAPESLVPTTAERASIFSGNRAYRWRAGAARERTKISVLSRFSGNSPAGERLLAPINLMPPRSKRKASREQIRSGAAFFLETSGDAPCEAGRIAKIARSRLKLDFRAAISSIPGGFSEPIALAPIASLAHTKAC
jgi:hypothetical protein